MSNEVATLPSRREITQVVDAVPIMDTARFEHFQRIANVMARSSMIPESLRTSGRKDDKEDLPFEQILSNCFLIVNQAARWSMDPFSVISCCSVVHGRLAYEGKLVAAVLDAKMGLKLHHHFVGDPASEAYRIYLSDVALTPEITAQLKPGISLPDLRLWDGSVAEWKTTGAGSPWSVKNFKRMLIYRGTRDWTRIYESALMLGVYTDDELMDLVEDARARRATPVASLADRLAASAPLPKPDGFSPAHVASELASHTEAQREAGTRIAPPASTGDEAQASEREPVSTGSGEAGRNGSQASPPNSNSSETTPSPSPAESQADKPASEQVARPDAGNNSSDQDSSAAPNNDADGEGGDGGPQTSSPPAEVVPGLPEGWGLAYTNALRRAQSKSSLPKFAKQFWDQNGGWEAHKGGPNAATAVAIYDVFSGNFGQRDVIDGLLRELI